MTSLVDEAIAEAIDVIDAALAKRQEADAAWLRWLRAGGNRSLAATSNNLERAADRQERAAWEALKALRAYGVDYATATTQQILDDPNSTLRIPLDSLRAR